MVDYNNTQFFKILPSNYDWALLMVLFTLVENTLNSEWLKEDDKNF